MKPSSTNPFTPFTINLRGRPVSIERPMVMGILNVTSDSFYSPSRAEDTGRIAAIVAGMDSDGADIIDVGGCSSRPGAREISIQEEAEHVIEAIKTIRLIRPTMPISVDTYRAQVARMAIEAGADIINDISGGDLDADMIPTVAQLGVPYIAMHMRGTPANMQQLTDYGSQSITEAVITSLAEKVNRCVAAGINDIIVDPGFGFAKTLHQNYDLFGHLPQVREAFNLPILVGISRKSMATKPLDITAEEALIPTTVLNTLALSMGASILRVHDVKAAVQAVTLTQFVYN